MRLLRQQESTPFFTAEEGRKRRFFQNFPCRLHRIVLQFSCLRIWAFPSALTAHRTFVRVNFGVISVWARRRPRCGKEDLHALRRDVIHSRRCTGCIVPLRGVRMEGSGLSLGKSRGRSRSGFGSSRVRGLRRGRFHRDSFSPSRLFFPYPVSPCVGRTHFFVCPIA